MTAEVLQRWAALGDGYRVEARIVVWHAEDAIHIPASALFRDGAAWAVFLRAGDRAAVRKVEVGRRSGVRAQITSGVVIIHPGDAVADRTKVAAR